ncbi:hypothetical protein QML06_31170, partial [Klebsiella pneumoniae]|uniref:hypothetical protein n=1 Tax=Klebsiella pneumoniae TaxID=573 RepID=UPI003A836FB9
MAQPPPGETEPSPPAPQVEHRNWVDDPYAPHVTDGTLLRVGSAIGDLSIDQRKYSGIGGVIAWRLLAPTPSDYEGLDATDKEMLTQ